MYRLAVYGGGAFELCLPSLGFFLTKLTLRCRFWAFVDRMTMSWGEDHQIATVSYGGEQALVCEHYAMRSVSVAHRPSGPPDCVSTVSNISTVMSRILSRIFGSFGLIVADGNSW